MVCSTRYFVIFVHVELLTVNRSTRARFAQELKAGIVAQLSQLKALLTVWISVYVCMYIYIGLRAQVPLASAGSLTTLDKVYPHNQESLGTQLQWAQDLMTSWSEMDHSQGKKCTVARSRLKAACIV